jgi:hypothetical protein
MARYLAWITPVDLGAQIGGGPIYPEPPVDPGYGIPIGGTPSHPIFFPDVPAHPIVLPPPAPGYKPEHPIFLPPPAAPANPIYIPSPVPPQQPGEPAHPIVIPPPPPDAPLEPVVGWTARTGWVVVFVPAEGTVLPTPSGGGGKK